MIVKWVPLQGEVDENTTQKNTTLKNTTQKKPETVDVKNHANVKNHVDVENHVAVKNHAGVKNHADVKNHVPVERNIQKNTIREHTKGVEQTCFILPTTLTHSQKVALSSQVA